MELMEENQKKVHLLWVFKKKLDRTQQELSKRDIIDRKRVANEVAYWTELSSAGVICDW